MHNAHEGLGQVNQSRISILTTRYELFNINEGESIQDMHTQFTYIVNKLKCLMENIMIYKLVKKILIIKPYLWKSKVNSISKAKYIQKMMMDEVIGNLKIYELK